MMKKILAAVGAMAIVIGGGIMAFSDDNTVPELTSYVDEDVAIQIQEDDTPLARSFFRFANANDDDDIKISKGNTTVINGVEVPLAKSYFSIANHQIGVKKIDGVEVPLSICYVADWFSGGNEPSCPSPATPKFSYTDPVMETSIQEEETPL